MLTIDQRATKQYAGEFAWPTVVMAFTLFFAFWMFVALAFFEIIPLWLTAVLNTILAYLIFTPLHEAAHGNVRGNHKNLYWLEQLVGIMSGMLLLGPFSSFRFIHLAHHAHTNDHDHDPDMWVHGRNHLEVAIRCLSILPYYYFFFFSSPKRAARKYFISAILWLLSFAGLAIYLGAKSSMWLPLFAWIVPGICANGLLAFFLDFIPHVPHDKLYRYHNSNVIFGKAIYLVTMAHSFHIIHHLWPRIPFYSYKTAFSYFKEDLKKEGTPIFPSLKALFKSAKEKSNPQVL